MSPELLDPERFGIPESKGGRPTKQSDCYALGMVVTFGFQRNLDIAGEQRKGAGVGLVIVMDYQQSQEAGLDTCDQR